MLNPQRFRNLRFSKKFHEIRFVPSVSSIEAPSFHVKVCHWHSLRTWWCRSRSTVSQDVAEGRGDIKAFRVQTLVRAPVFLFFTMCFLRIGNHPFKRKLPMYFLCIFSVFPLCFLCILYVFLCVYCVDTVWFVCRKIKKEEKRKGEKKKRKK